MLIGFMLHSRMAVSAVIVYAQKEKQTHYPKTVNIFMNAKTSEAMSKPKLYASPIMMAKENWLESQFSLARYYGGMKLNGVQYCIVNRHGKPYWGQIIPTEPADLVIVDWTPLYRKVGRERFMEIVKKTNDLTEAKRMAEEEK